MTQTEAAFLIWKTWRQVLDAKGFTDELLISICEEEEEEWQNTYLKLAAREGKDVITELGLTTMPNSSDGK